MDYPSRLQLMHLIFGIAIADGTISGSETMLVNKLPLIWGLMLQIFNR